MKSTFLPLLNNAADRNRTIQHLQNYRKKGGFSTSSIKCNQKCNHIFLLKWHLTIQHFSLFFTFQYIRCITVCLIFVTIQRSQRDAQSVGNPWGGGTAGQASDIQKFHITNQKGTDKNQCPFLVYVYAILYAFLVSPQEHSYLTMTSSS